ncbi:anti-anti-sigma factor [Mycolicibacterium duvalii]|uniref:Anti-sigma factor antagonist n=1 Tax=Mycolicibacterium duvalii TaxID=39688 RepID=A0A7I7K7W3_9MYCO|nr:STAS domain-containing protein [Mycolicibacterium duvalii]MCV7366142.1 STAS domain-containing protein [Mycolicibacterium duvalii]PEG38800.1 anti-anti-sigma factor [Mycolicibacterium duvalii]BBX19591.1 anti-sigma factor antagonist [Mycolicibacterium duvalii]
MNLTVTVTHSAPAARVQVAGDLAYGSTAALTDTVTELCRDTADLDRLHLDFADLTFCDSAGLSALLQIHRRLCLAGIGLQLDHRPAHLERILDVTGLLDYLTTTPVPVPVTTPDETELG